MKGLLLLTWKSMVSRRFTVVLTIISIALSVILLLGVERIRHESKNGFMNTISGTDLVVGARSGAVQLLLYSVFHIGNATNNISWQSYQELAARPQVQWTIPVSLGDSHKGYRVVGTSGEFFNKYLYADKQSVVFEKGHVFQDIYDVVIGSEVARKLGYSLDKKIILSHGAGDVSFYQHKDSPFTVVGILKPTSTPIDRSLFVKLEGITAIHVGWKDGSPPQHGLPAQLIRRIDLTPKEITAFFMKVDSPLAIFSMQRTVNNYRDEALSAVLPGVALQELWNITGLVERALLIIAGFVVITGLFGMLTTLLTSLGERRREMAILRSVGARPVHIFSLLIGEAVAITSLGIVAGFVLSYGLLMLLRPVLVERFSFYLTCGSLTQTELLLLAAIWCSGLLVGIVPALKMYCHSLQDGLTIRF